MGLADRDYMKERYRQRQGMHPEAGPVWNDRKARVELDSKGPRARHLHPAQSWILGLSALTVLIPAYREARRQGWLPDPEPARAFPASGDVTVNKLVDPRTATARLRVVAEDANAVVQLYDAETDRHVISVYVRRDDDVTVPVPPGSYRVKLIEGDKWHGPVRYFGASTTSDTVIATMTFDPHMGRGIDLNRRPNGNLHTRADVSDPRPLD